MYFKESVYRSRVDRVMRSMEQGGVDFMLIPPGPNFFYLTGLETESMERIALLILEKDSVKVICPELMKEQILEETWVRDIISWGDDTDPYMLAGQMLKNSKNTAIEGNLPYFHYKAMRKYINGLESDADQIMNSLRIEKDEGELAAIREAVRRSERSLQNSIGEINEGITEKKFSTILEEEMQENGLDSPAFSSIVSFGKNAALPHHSPDGTKLVKGDSVVIDFGGRYMGYASDTTRTFFFGNPGEEMMNIYEAVKQANQKVEKKIDPQTTYSSMDAMARSVIDTAGYGDRFIHRLGHGLGISVHEEPYLVPKNTHMVMKNSVFTVEPGIYIPGKGGVRIEDTNYFDGSTCVSFNKLKKDLFII
ncbi:Xaa-Pro peptidase family protein [Oxyplasma meridianum]|uniref:Xaa-Pro peptidase family protein n=1 Tax=Oxyplasma meridianum TaxID=3073602 RepID=A0AAX4NHZ1_9ARCH